MSATPPIAAWLDRQQYPFHQHYLEVEGQRMHYIDHGHGPVVVLVHGSAVWSFVYRHLIMALAPHYRCIAFDHLGFGLSDKPATAGYQPEDHARRLRLALEQLQLGPFRMVVHDFGGPIGLSYALQHPTQIRSLVLFNTWMWSLKGHPMAEMAGLSSRGWLGDILFEQLNLETQVLVPLIWGRGVPLSRAVHQQYLGPLARPSDRQAVRRLATALRSAAPWYETLWQQRERIAHIPALLAWGMRDPFFRADALARWQQLFQTQHTVTFPGIGHFVQEEAHPQLREIVPTFLRQMDQQGASHEPASHPITMGL